MMFYNLTSGFNECDVQHKMESSKSSRTGQIDHEHNGLDTSELGQAYGSVGKHQGALSMGAGKPIPPPLPDSKEYIVEFDGPDDPVHPLNWSFTVKYASLV